MSTSARERTLEQAKAMGLELSEDGTSWVPIGKQNVEPPAVKQGISEPIVQVLPVRHRIRKVLLGLGLLAGLAIIAFSLSDAQLGRDTGESCTTGFGKCTDEDRQAIQIIGIFWLGLGVLIVGVVGYMYQRNNETNAVDLVEHPEASPTHNNEFGNRFQ
tara:strand:+ start:116 stop:592 length:477 start_codon:yes stop_codon:yes gene_type:complete